MKSFNLSDWALGHRSLVWYFMIAFMAAGLFSYFHLGKSVTVPGQTTVFVYLRDSTKARDVKPTWVRVRNLIADIKGDLPQGVIGPGFDDSFGDVFGNI